MVTSDHPPRTLAPDTSSIQRRTLTILFIVQIISGVGFAVGGSVGALLTAEMAGVELSGLAQSAVVVGGALFAIPMTALVRNVGRRPSLALGYGLAGIGAAIIVAAAQLGSVAALFPGYLLLGGAVAAGFQARYAALDLAPVSRRGRHLSLVVWATTLGAVAGPNLAPVAGHALAPFGIPVLAAPFAFSAVLLGLASILLLTLLRPDPMVIARELRSEVSDAPPSRAPHQVGMRAALSDVLARPASRLGLIAMAIGHLIMVAVMAMTPIHIRAAGHDPAHTLRIVGIVLSVHIAGMYALAPVSGWLTDRLGRMPVIGIGIVLLILACALAGTAHNETVPLAIALGVLGLGWSSTIVAGSAMLTESVPDHLRASAQGVSDMIMGLAGATAGALSGVVVATWDYRVLAAVAAAATLPLIAEAVRFYRHPAKAGAAPLLDL